MCCEKCSVQARGHKTERAKPFGPPCSRFTSTSWTPRKSRPTTPRRNRSLRQASHTPTFPSVIPAVSLHQQGQNGMKSGYPFFLGLPSQPTPSPYWVPCFHQRFLKHFSLAKLPLSCFVSVAHHATLVAWMQGSKDTSAKCFAIPGLLHLPPHLLAHFQPHFRPTGLGPHQAHLAGLLALGVVRLCSLHPCRSHALHERRPCPCSPGRCGSCCFSDCPHGRYVGFSSLGVPGGNLGSELLYPWSGFMLMLNNTFNTWKRVGHGLGHHNRNERSCTFNACDHNLPSAHHLQLQRD